MFEVSLQAGRPPPQLREPGTGVVVGLELLGYLDTGHGGHDAVGTEHRQAVGVFLSQVSPTLQYL